MNVRGWSARMHVPALDVALALGLTVTSLLLGREKPPPGWHSLGTTGLVLVCAVNLVTVARRVAPVLVMAAVSIGWAVYIAAGFWPVVNSLAALLALYSVAASRPPREAAGCAGALVAVWLYAGLSNPAGSMATVAMQAVVMAATLWKFGDNARQLALRNAELARLADQLRREQEERSRHAVTYERVRIARELHDVVAHHLSVVSVQAGLAQYVFDSDRDTARGAVETIASTGREALEEVRRLLVLLRAPLETEPSAPAPDLGSLDDLAERVRESGVAVSLLFSGRKRPLAPGAELCLHRVVQESLTNVLKHAPAASAVVRIHYGEHEVSATVTDDGPGPTRPGGGHGVVGMRERARLYGGTLAAGPGPDGGFEVALTLPV
ncbi:sensor histidine kinase [Streptomyces sp. NPDC057499]|uniref:sensor histidine kinase n=1 Tax=Streptomyces sp. NPDC057499 TaxID=3346150 RepID=UPI0036B384B3